MAAPNFKDLTPSQVKNILILYYYNYLAARESKILTAKYNIASTYPDLNYNAIINLDGVPVPPDACVPSSFTMEYMFNVKNPAKMRFDDKEIFGYVIIVNASISKVGEVRIKYSLVRRIRMVGNYIESVRANNLTDVVVAAMKDMVAIKYKNLDFDRVMPDIVLQSEDPLAYGDHTLTINYGLTRYRDVKAWVLEKLVPVYKNICTKYLDRHI